MIQVISAALPLLYPHQMKNRKNSCPPDQVALKSFFLGPQGENGSFLKNEISDIVADWIDWRGTIYPEDGVAIAKSEQQSVEFQRRLQLFRNEVRKVSKEFKSEIPKFSPRYIGHMFSEFSMPALLGHIICLLHNPNNISQESSRVGVDLEQKAIQHLASMLGYSKHCAGHFTSGGTVANFEAVARSKAQWIKLIQQNAERKMSFFQASHAKYDGVKSDKNNLDLDDGDFALNQWITEKYNVRTDGPVILVPASGHYSWNKAARFFGLGKHGLIPVDLDPQGRMDLNSLKSKIEYCRRENRPILAIVSICGSTELGTIDPIDGAQDIIDTYAKNDGLYFWHHIDAAYGGFFATLKKSKNLLVSEEIKKSLQAIGRSNSITIDPHKLGYVPYSSGAFLCRDKRNYFITESAAPYVDFKNGYDPGPYSIEGSRSAAGAVATYLTAKSIGFNLAGYGQILLKDIKNCEDLKVALAESDLPILFVDVERTNILCFAIGTDGMKMSEINRRTEKVINQFQKPQRNKKSERFFISKTTLALNFEPLLQSFSSTHNIKRDSASLLVIRLTLMNPFFNSRHTKTNFSEEFITTLKKII